MAREQSKSRGQARSSSTSRKSSRSRSRGRTQKSTPPSGAKKSKSPERKSSPATKSTSPARPKSSAKKSTSPHRAHSPTKKTPAKKTTSPKRSPAKKAASSPARGRSATRKGGSPARGRSPPAKKSTERSKSPTKKAARPKSKSPARIRTSLVGTSLADSREKSDVGDNLSAVRGTPIMKTTPNAVVSPMTQTTLRHRSSLLSGTPLNSVSKRESLFEGTATLFEKQKGSISFADEPSGTLRMSARIASMQASKEVEEAEKEKAAAASHVPLLQATRWTVLERLKSFGWVPTITALLWLVLTPAMLIGLYLLCGKERCSVSVLPTLPKAMRSYLHWKIGVGYGVFLLLQALLQAIPVGRTVYGFPCKLFRHHVAYRYRLNGWLHLLGTVLVFAALTHYGYPVTAAYRYCFQLLMTALVVSAVLSLVFYVKGQFASKNHRNPTGNTGNVVHDFVVGREINPRIGEMYDLSVLLFRTGLMSMVVLLGSMIWYEYVHTERLNYNFAISAFCGLFYIVVAVFSEEYFLSSVFVSEEGLGYMAIAGYLAAMPFVGVFPAKFLLEHKQVLPVYCLPGIVTLFLVGLSLHYVAHKRKYCFRRNWPDPSSRGMGLDYLADKSGNRLLVSGTWGFVRHPNYLGDLLCTLALTLPCGFRHFLPYYGLLVSAVFLAIRTFEVERRCKERYADLWTKYTERVKYRIVPYVF